MNNTIADQNDDTDSSDVESVTSLKNPNNIPSLSPASALLPVPSSLSSSPVSKNTSLSLPPSASSPSSSSQQQLYNHRIVLTTYPGQVGISPIPLNWGNPDPRIRGPIVASRIPTSMKVRNAIGAHGGSYSVYRALAIAIRELEPSHRPDLHNTEPVVKIGPFPSWGDPSRIVSLDPWGKNLLSFFVLFPASLFALLLLPSLSYFYLN